MPAEKPKQQPSHRDTGQQGRPAQVPGDAESPPKGTPSEAARKAPTHTDPTEPTHSEQDNKAR